MACLWAQPVDPSLYNGMHWRLIGPFRGGKATKVSGIPGNPTTYQVVLFDGEIAACRARRVALASAATNSFATNAVQLRWRGLPARLCPHRFGFVSAKPPGEFCKSL